MSALQCQVQPGAYADSIVLMQLQAELQRLAGVLDAGVVMGTEVNLQLLAASQLLDDDARSAGPNDLVVAVRAESAQKAQAALDQVESLLSRQPSSSSSAYRPHSLESALAMVPTGSWVSISTPGRHAAALADRALDHGCPIFLYSDNVSKQQEKALKSKAAERGALVMGPDCGSAIIGGIGFGFSNAVRRGPVGMVCASGTGLQAISSQLHRLGSGVSQAIGTGGRDLSDDVGGSTARQGLDLLARDPATEVVVLASKPPGPEVGSEVLAAALGLGKPVVVYFSGTPAPAPRVANLHFARTSTEAAEIALDLLDRPTASAADTEVPSAPTSNGFLRGLFSGGTLALETLQGVAPFLNPVYSNLNSLSCRALEDPTRSLGHTILDMGADEYTVGRLHPMMDPGLRSTRLRQEAADTDTGLILFDVVLGRGAHPDPAAETAPVVAEIVSQGGPPCLALLLGTHEDTQGLEATADRLTEVGAEVVTTISEALPRIVHICGQVVSPPSPSPSIELLERPAQVINIGLETFQQELIAQEVAVVQVDWRPPAGGNEQLMSILERMKS